MTSPEVLEFRTRPGLSRRRVTVLVLLLVLALAVAAALWLRDRRQTIDQAELEAAVGSFRPEGSTRTIAADDFEHGLSTDPDRCEALLDPGAAGAQGGASWTEPDQADVGLQLDSVRYADPGAARAAVAAVRSAAPACARFVIEPRDVGDEGAHVVITTPTRHWWSARSQQRFTLRALDPNGFDFAVQVRRYGNVVVWGYSQTERAADGAAAVAELVGRLRASTTG